MDQPKQPEVEQKSDKDKVEEKDKVRSEKKKSSTKREKKKDAGSGTEDEGKTKEKTKEPKPAKESGDGTVKKVRSERSEEKKEARRIEKLAERDAKKEARKKKKEEEGDIQISVENSNDNISPEVATSPPLSSSSPSATSAAAETSDEAGGELSSSAGDSAKLNPLSAAKKGKNLLLGTLRRKAKTQQRGSFVFSGCLMVAKKDFKSEEFEFNEGDILTFVERDDNNWVHGATEDGRSGWFPRNLVDPFTVGSEKAMGIKSPLAVTEDVSSGVSSTSVIDSKDETKEALKKFLNVRPTVEELGERSPQLMNQEADDKNKDKLKKKKVKLQRFFSQATLRRGQVPGLTKQSSSVFGMSLTDLLAGNSASGIPVIIRDCVEFLNESNAHQIEGIFRKSGSQYQLDAIKAQYTNPNAKANLKEVVEDPHVVAVMLKQFLGSMAEPVIPFEQYTTFVKTFNSCGNEAEVGEKLSELINKELPATNRRVLYYLLTFLSKIAAHSETNLMTAANLGVVFGPNLFRPQVADTVSLMDTTSSKIVEYLIENIATIFTECNDLESGIPKDGSSSSSAASSSS